jgi:hypothetical protein
MAEISGGYSGAPSPTAGGETGGYAPGTAPVVYQPPAGHSGSYIGKPDPNLGTPVTGLAPLTDSQTGAMAYLRNVLDSYGLGDLTEWAMGEIRKGYGQEKVLQDLRETPSYKTRFKVIQDRADAGLPPISPAQVVEYERTAAQLMGRYGVPRGFYDKPEDFHDLLLRDVSAQELQSRLESGYARVLTAPPEVRSVFKDFFGADSNQALAAFFLDPDKAQPVLEQQLAAGLDAGAGRRLGYDVTKDTAMKLASVGISEDEAAKGFLQLSGQKGLFAENFGEQTDITQDQGAEAVFGLSADAQRKIDRRTQERTAAFNGQGGALQTNEGVRGAGAADQ